MGKADGVQPLLSCLGVGFFFFGLMDVLANDILLVTLNVKKAGRLYLWNAER